MLCVLTSGDNHPSWLRICLHIWWFNHQLFYFLSTKCGFQDTKWVNDVNDMMPLQKAETPSLARFGIWMFPKIVGYPQIIHFNWVFHHKPSIYFRVPLFLETPIWHIDAYSTLPVGSKSSRILPFSDGIRSIHLDDFVFPTWKHQKVSHSCR